MFRKYTPKKNVQKKVAYTDRFYVTPSIEKGIIKDEVILQAIKSLQDLGVEIIEQFCMREQAVVYVNPAQIVMALEILKNKHSYEQLVEMSAIDYLEKRSEFELFYELLSFKTNKRLRIKLCLSQNEHAQSATQIYHSASWAEKECYDMYGIIFDGHENLRRILMPDDWVGHPLLKSYPLQGDEFARWYEVDKLYGKEAREIIGDEIRDAAMIERYDTTRFAKIGKEVPRGAKYSEEEKKIEYTPDRIKFLYDDFSEENQKIIKGRK